MNSNNLEPETQQVIAVNWAERWQIYYRLQALDIPCECGANQPLKMRLDTVKTAIQLWSVARQFTASSSELVEWLKGCWQIESKK
jgi:hypothetical protein